MIWFTCLYGLLFLTPTLTLKGRVLDTDHNPIAVCDVAVYKDTQLYCHTTTDGEGKFTMTITPDTFLVVFTILGCNPQDQKRILAQKNENIDLGDILLQPCTTPLASRTFNYKVPLQKKNQHSTEKIQNEQIKNLPITHVKAKVTCAAGISNSINIRSTRSASTCYYIDGVRVKGRLPRQNDPENGLHPESEVQKSHTLTGKEWNPFTHTMEWKDIFSSLEAAPLEPDYACLFARHCTDIYLLTDEDLPVVNTPCILTKNDGEEQIFVSDHHGMIRLPRTEGPEEYQIKTAHNTTTFRSPKHSVDHYTNTSCKGWDMPMDKSVEIAFVVDQTGSQTDELEFLKGDLIELIRTLSGQNVNYKFAAVFYSDYSGDLPYQPLTSEVSSLQKFVEEKHCFGGSEVLDLAFDDALNKLEWSAEAQSKLMFWMLDHQYAEQPLDAQLMMNNIQRAQSMGIHIIPITGSGIDRSMEYFMKMIAIHTGGSYIGLTDDSGIGLSHLQQRSNDLEVELLSDILLRIIEEYADIQTCQDPPQYNHSSEACSDLQLLSNIVSQNDLMIHSTSIEYAHIVDEYGRLVKNLKIHPGGHLLDCSSLTNGTYQLAYGQGCNLTFLIAR